MSSSSDSSEDSGRLNLQKANSKDSCKKVKKHLRHKSVESKKNSSVENVKKSILNDNTELQKTKMPSEKFKGPETRSLRSDKHRSDAMDKPSSTNSKKKKGRTEESECCSNSEAQTAKKHVEKTTRKRATSKSQQPNFVHLHNEEADSSSGQEFQKSKISLDSSKLIKKLSRVRDDCTSSRSSTEKQMDKIRISKDQSLYFKSKVIKIINRFKTVCSEYELQMEHVKWKHFKKELIYQESAINVIQRSKNVINKLKMELDDQENKLMTFAEEWNKKCSAQNTDHDDSSSSSREALETTEVQDKSHPLGHNIYSNTSSENESIVSGCDNKTIFSENEASEIDIDKKKKKKLLSINEITEQEEDDNNKNATSLVASEAVSPILGNGTTKSLSDDPNTNDKLEIIDKSKECSDDFQDGKANDSLKDIFEESTVENDIVENTSKEEEMEIDEQETFIVKENNGETQANVDLNNDDNASKGNELNREINSIDSEVNEEGTVVLGLALSRETICTKGDDTESVETVRIENDTTKHSSLDEPDDEEEQAKRALLESDSEMISNDESVSEKSGTLSIKTVSTEERQVEQSKSKKKGRRKETGDDSVNTNSLACKGNDITELSAKRALLDSNSDDSNGSSTKGTSEKVHESDDNSKNKRAKALLLNSSNSESSSSDDGNSLQFPKLGQSTSSEKQKPEDKQESLQGESAESIGSMVSKRNKKIRRKLSNKRDFESDKKLKMECRVVLKRLPKEILVKHASALEKSRQHLDSKQIKSLINLDRLQRSTKKAIDPPQSSTPRKLKQITETEDTLLDHLKKVENGELTENSVEDAVVETESISMTPTCDMQTNKELMEDADKLTKSLLLNSDGSDIENQNNADSPNSSSDEKNKTKKSKSGSDARTPSQKAEKKGSGNDEEAQEKREKSQWRRNKLLTTNFSTSDSEVESAKWDTKQEKLKQKAEENKAENSDAEDTVVKRKRRPRRKILDSDSDIQLLDSDSSSSKSVTLASDQSLKAESDKEKKQKKSLKRKTRKSSDTDSSLGEKKVKPKRKRIKKVATDSDDDSDEDPANSQGTPGKKGRKNIRKVLKDKQVADDTKLAAKEEEERLKRIEDRQKLYNEMYEARLANEEKVDKLVLDFNAETKEDLVSVHPDIVKRLKPHQAKGIKFMWDACFESLERIKSTSGTGCIIAHCMGLGKSLQVIALSHTLLNHEETGIKTIMIVCPLSTVLNWYNEFNLWLKDVDNCDIEVYELTKLKKCIERKFQLKSWHRTGGVLLIGYEMFRNLSGTNNKMRKAMKEEILRYLIDPGPDLIVCDEGHLLKNEDTALSKSMRRIKTLRRIILTGTPLQNNLIEYHCMVQFVKPKLLGTKKEFLNRFANPINNGQYDDSTEYDVKLMKKRAYVLHKMLKGCVQRFDYSVLTPFLPPKQEYVIFVRLSEVQIKMYRYYLDNLARRQRSANGSLFADFQTLQRIWTHPVVMRLNAERVEKLNEKKFSSDDSEGSLKDFIDDDDDSDTDSTSRSSDENDDGPNAAPKTSRCTRSTQPDIEPIPKPEETEKKEEDWWVQFTEADHFEDISVSSKLMLLFGILKECEQIGDKVLVFSQSLYSLTLIQKFLSKIDDETQKSDDSDYMGYRSSWALGLDYFRLDGQTSPENRSIWCKIFNNPSNMRARLFLISTRAGGLGINLTAANRVIIFDASWNPSYDVQSIFRVYRFGQKKPCYVYRFLAFGTMEEKIYNRQVTKLSLSCRVVDEQQIERHYRNNDLNELYTFEPNVGGEKPTLNLPKDRLLAEIFLKYKDYVENYHEHDSLLENKAEEELNEEERKQAWLEYEEEKKGKPPVLMHAAGGMTYLNNMRQFNNVSPWLNVNNDYEKLQELIRKDYPNATPEYQKMMTARVLTDMYSYWERQAFHGTSDAMRTTQVPNIVRTPHMPQMPQMAQMPQMVRNLTKTSGQDTRPDIPFTYVDNRTSDPKYGDDDDIVEVIPTPATTGKNKNQEE